VINGWADIFRAGDYRAYKKGTFGPADLDELVRHHRPGTVPLVVGHPKTNSPAWGWVDQLRRAGDVLQATFKQVHEGFAAAVNEGRYPKRSVKIRTLPDGTRTLVHVGWLGAEPPQVEGLAPFTFDGGDDESADVIEFNMTEETVSDETNKGLTMEQVQTMINTAVQAKEVEFSARLNAVTVERDAAKAERDAAKAQAHRQSCETFIGGLVGGKKLTPALAVGVVEFLSALDDAVEIEFSAGGAPQKQTPAKWFRNFVEKLPESGIFSVAAGPDSAPGAGGEVEFSADGTVSGLSLEWERKARAYAREHKCSYEEAAAATAG